MYIPKSNNTEGDIWQGEVSTTWQRNPPGHKPRLHTPEEVIEALKVSRGLKAMAARHLGCSLSTVQKACADYPDVQAECEMQLEAFVDTAYLQLMTKVQQGDVGAVFFVLKTLGRSRGFSERHEVTGKDGGPIEHAHIHLWEERLQAVHNEMAAKKAAMMLERTAEGGYEAPRETV